MNIRESITLSSRGDFVESAEWKKILFHIELAVEMMEWPEGTGKFIAYDKVHGNGVKGITEMFARNLAQVGLSVKREHAIPDIGGDTPGDVDFIIETSGKPVAVEWETGNISSAYRSMAKLCEYLRDGSVSAAVMILGDRKSSTRYFTDRISSFDELKKHRPRYASYEYEEGVLQWVVYAIDGVSKDVPPFGKGEDGRAKELKKAARRALKDLRSIDPDLFHKVMAKLDLHYDQIDLESDTEPQSPSTQSPLL